MDAKPANSMLMIQARRVDNASLNLGQLPLAQGLTRPGSRGCEGVTKTSFPGGRHVGNGPIVFSSPLPPKSCKGNPKRPSGGGEVDGLFCLSEEQLLREGGLTSKLHVVCNTQGRPVRLHRSQGQCSADPPSARRHHLDGRQGIGRQHNPYPAAGARLTPCIPSRRHRNKRLPASKRLYNMRHKVERPVGQAQGLATHCHPLLRCDHVFLSAVLLGATFISWFSGLSLGSGLINWGRSSFCRGGVPRDLQEEGWTVCSG